MTEPILQKRDREVLSAVVRNYLHTGEPVASKTVSREHPESRSSATIRHVMADLEQAGLLSQPHTSAGRVPTDRGLRFYVETLLQREPVPPDAQAHIDRALGTHRGEAADLLERASQLLAELSHNVGIVLLPDFSHRVFEKISFVGIGPRRIAALFVSRPGMVDHRVIEVEEDYSQEDLERISRYLSEAFRGLSLRQIRSELLRLMSEEKGQYDRLMREAFELSRRSFGAGEDSRDLILEGTANLLDAKLFESAEKMKSIFQAFEEKSRLVSILNRCLDADGCKIVIGAESEAQGVEGCALVVSPYRYGARPVGTVGILGPTRMEYARAIALVEALSQRLTDLLSTPDPPRGVRGNR